jgi:hypothetical protein
VKVDRKPYLLAANTLAAASSRVIYCATAPAGFKQDLLARLTRSPAGSFDHGYAAYARVLHDYVRPPRVDYASLVKGRAALDAAVAVLAAPAATDEAHWPREQRLAFWINAYNTFTLRAIVDHYPIRGSWLSLSPHNSIRQIDGVWTTLMWRAAGRTVTLDDIEHKILRPQFSEPRVHFAINCASVGCPPLSADPYRPATLNEQLDAAARRYLAREQGLQIRGDTLRVSRILEWYGEDFETAFAPEAAGKPDRLERVARAVVVRFGLAAAQDLARKPSTRIKYLDYDWSLNDVK